MDKLTHDRCETKFGVENSLRSGKRTRGSMEWRKRRWYESRSKHLFGVGMRMEVGQVVCRSLG